MSNGHYHLVITNAGGGYSRWGDLAITRWREDATRDNWGTFIYLRDTASGDFWSCGYQPTLNPVEHYEVIFAGALAEFRHRLGDLDICTEVCLSAEDDVEFRRVTLRNRSCRTRSIELTSYAEVVLAPSGADLAHPVFSNLFVQTEFLDSALLCTRRPRSEGERTPWFLHFLAGEGDAPDTISCETDRARFIGRGRTPANPVAMVEASALSNTTGSVLDPIVSLRQTVRLAPGDTACLDFVFGVTENREAALSLITKYRKQRAVDRALDLARTENASLQQELTEGSLPIYERLAGALIYADPAQRAASSVLLHSRRGQSGLWSLGISGDIPILLLSISDPAKIGIVQQLIQAHAFWRRKALAVDLVILNENVSGSTQALSGKIAGLIAAEDATENVDKPGGIFVRQADQISAEDRMLLQSAARVVLAAEDARLAEPQENAAPAVPDLTSPRLADQNVSRSLTPRELVFDNGLGGFTTDGAEYVITLRPGRVTPAPWVNVIANPDFGTVISEGGSAYSWAENSHEFRLTPWNNDPVTDATGEAFYIRDEESGYFWSPTSLPAGDAAPYVVRHGFGYSVFEHTGNGIVSEMMVYVAIDAPIKFITLKLRNASGRRRRLSVFGYWEWVLGDLRQKNSLHVQTEVDDETRALLARNYYNTDFPERIAFVAVSDRERFLTGDRKEFLGRNGTMSSPAALKRAELSGNVGAGLDPCGAVQVRLDLEDGQEEEIGFRLGAGHGLTEVQNLIHRFRDAQAAQAALESVRQYWKQTLGAVQVETPDPSVNLMANGWLLYQVLSCRLWGRTGFYQSGGAFGFRDQLQDVMALVHAAPGLTREHLLRAAAKQFREGDVLHWWHPPMGRGVRTHTSDDYLWLPYVTSQYVSGTGDMQLLDERVSFLEGRPLKPEEESYYDLPKRADESGTLYEHCVRAIEHGLRFGVHGLPLIGSCDWNDGMNLVGKEGRGESVWLAFFLYEVLTRFAEVARRRDDTAFSSRCLAEAEKLKTNIEREAWDGDWYRRAYFDNGEPLGSKVNLECQIDSLPQSWSVISGAGDPQRARRAMESLNQRLVRREAKLIQLLDPPFDRSDLHPGYIKGYVPGVRENGGQYTHAAVWAVMAFALLGDHDRVWELVTLLNPIQHSTNPAQTATYKVEPYVVAADVYAVAPHTGRGGWTWYTGSAGWMYRLLTETLLGLNPEGNQLYLKPRLPGNWSSCKIHYRHRDTLYHITVYSSPESSEGPSRIFVDGRELAGDGIPLEDDHREHAVEVRSKRAGIQ